MVPAVPSTGALCSGVDVGGLVGIGRAVGVGDAMNPIGVGVFVGASVCFCPLGVAVFVGCATSVIGPAAKCFPVVGFGVSVGLGVSVGVGVSLGFGSAVVTCATAGPAVGAAREGSVGSGGLAVGMPLDALPDIVAAAVPKINARANKLNNSLRTAIGNLKWTYSRPCFLAALWAIPQHRSLLP